jgi:hypothetical protein
LLLPRERPQFFQMAALTAEEEEEEEEDWIIAGALREE